MLAAEAVLLSVVATLVGTVQLPWLPLGVVLLIAALAGLLACVLPARRAARMTPAAGLSPRLIPSSIAWLPRAISNELPEHGRTFPNQRCNTGS
jgi:hypothetical protein